jgi:hypothetical protein
MDIQKYKGYKAYNCLTPAVKSMLNSKIQPCYLHLPEELLSFFETQYSLEKYKEGIQVKYVSDCLLKLIVLGLLRAEEFGDNFEDLRDMSLAKMLEKL